MLQRTHQAIAIVGFKRKPLLLVGIGRRKSESSVEIPVVTRDREEAAHLRPQAVRCGQVECVIPLQNVEGAPVGLHAT